MNQLIDLLRLENAPNDTARAAVLFALVSYGKACNDMALVEAANAAMPLANPLKPPAEWAKRYKEGFCLVADPDCGVEPDDCHLNASLYWRNYLTDEQRRERLANPVELGFEDGQSDAQALNDA